MGAGGAEGRRSKAPKQAPPSAQNQSKKFKEKRNQFLVLRNGTITKVCRAIVESSLSLLLTFDFTEKQFFDEKSLLTNDWKRKSSSAVVEKSFFFTLFSTKISEV